MITKMKFRQKYKFRVKRKERPADVVRNNRKLKKNKRKHMKIEKVMPQEETREEFLYDHILTEKEFEESMKRFFEARLKSDGWKYFRRTLFEFCRIFDSHLSRACHSTFQIISKHILQLIHESDITDVDVISRIIYAHQHSFQEYNPPSETTIWCTEEPYYTKEEYSVHSHRLEPPIMWELRQAVIPFTKWNPKYFAVMVLSAVGNKRYRFLHFLVKLHKAVFPPPDVRTLERFVRSFIKNMESTLEYLERKALREGARARLFRDKLPWCGLFNANGKQEIVNPVVELVRYISIQQSFSFRRMVLIILTINCILQAEREERVNSRSTTVIPENTHLRAKCLNLLTEAMPDSFITIADVEKFMASFYIGVNTCMFMEHVTDLFKKELPKIEEFPKPRSLKDLARCKIRSCLRKNEVLHEQVSELPIPTRLQNFLLFKDRKLEELDKK